MAATTDQLALTKANRTPNVATSTRQAVPAFLNKLYNMVSNPETDELVRWSDEGDSFYIPSHERLSKELLPRFFKHGNFSSFVRQLNMYGFHKVPHLQQGVLQNSTETELWQFQNPHFQRGQPDLLCLITRKKTGANVDGVGVPDEIQQGTNVIGGPASTTAASNNHPPSGSLDLTVLASSLGAIKKHQTSLSTELKTLQESNQHLWNEALAARDRHKKHQDTINKILKFLASVFGNGPNGATPSASAGGQPSGRDGRASPGALVPRKRPRLMIENGSADDIDEDDEETGYFEAHVSPDLAMLEDHEMTEGRISEAPLEAPTVHPQTSAERPSLSRNVSASGGAKLEPPPTPSLESVASTFAATPPITRTSSSSLSSAPPASPMTVARRSPTQPLSTPTPTPAAVPTPSPHTSAHSNPSSTPAPVALPQPDQHDNAQDQLYQETISKLLSSPNALQRILATLSSQGPDHAHTHPPHSSPQTPIFPDPAQPHPQSELAPYYGNLLNMNLNAPMDMTLEPHMARLDEGTEALGDDVDSVQHDINNLIREWGFTPEMLDQHSSVGADMGGMGIGGQHGVGMDGFNAQGYNPFDTHSGINGAGVEPYASIAPEGDTVDLDSFLNQFEFTDDHTHTTNSTASSATANGNHGTTTNGAGPSNAHTLGSFPVPLAAEFDLANPGPQSASFLDEVHSVPSGASDTSMSPAIPLLDDFSQAAPSPANTARFTSPAAPVHIQTQTTSAPAKRGRKRRSMGGDEPPPPEESATKGTRK